MKSNAGKLLRFNTLGVASFGLLTMPITITLPFDVPEVRVLASRVLEDSTLLIEVESTLRTASSDA